MDGLTVNTKTDDASDWVALEFGTDYTVTLNGANVSAQPVTDQSENAKAVAISLTEAGMKESCH